MINSSLGVKKGAWSEEEDNLLRKCIRKYGEGKWHLVPFRAGLNRCRKSCRLRWLNYLHPNIKRGCFNSDEVDLILRLHKLLGNRWSLIAGRIPGRTANDVKNYWNTHIQKKVFAMASSRQHNLKTNAPKITKNTVVFRPQPRRFLKTTTSSQTMTSFTGKVITTVAYDAHLKEQTTPPPNTLTENNVQQNNDNSNSNLPLSETTLDNRVEWWEDFLFDKEFNEEGQIGWTNFPTDIDLLELLS